MRKRKVLRLGRKNDGVMDDKSGDDDTGEVRRSWRRDDSGRGGSRRADEVSEEVDSRDGVMRSQENDR